MRSRHLLHELIVILLGCDGVQRNGLYWRGCVFDDGDGLLLPAALPVMLAGLRIGFTVALLSIIGSLE